MSRRDPDTDGPTLEVQPAESKRIRSHLHPAEPDLFPVDYFDGDMPTSPTEPLAWIDGGESTDPTEPTGPTDLHPRGMREPDTPEPVTGVAPTSRGGDVPLVVPRATPPPPRPTIERSHPGRGAHPPAHHRGALPPRPSREPSPVREFAPRPSRAIEERPAIPVREPPAAVPARRPKDPTPSRASQTPAPPRETRRRPHSGSLRVRTVKPIAEVPPTPAGVVASLLEDDVVLEPELAPPSAREMRQRLLSERPTTDDSSQLRAQAIYTYLMVAAVLVGGMVGVLFGLLYVLAA